MSERPRSAVASLFADYRNFAGARLWPALALMLGGAIAEGLGILLIVPLATIAIGKDLGGSLGRLSVLAAAVPPDRRFALVLVAFVAAMALRSLLIFARDRRLADLDNAYEASLRLRAASTLAERGWTFASRIGQAGMQSLLLNDVPRAGLAVAQSQAFLVAAVMLAVQFCIAAWLSPLLSLIALTIVAAASLMAIGWVRRGLRSGLALVESGETSTGSGFRLHAGLKAALAQGTVPQFIGEYRSSLEQARSETTRYQSDIAAARGLAFTASAVAAAVLLFVGYRLLGLPFPILVTSLVLFARMAAPAQQLQQSAQHIAAYAPSFAAIEERLHGLDPVPQPRPAARPLEWSALRVRSVGHRHGEGLGLVRASFDLVPGQWLGIGGASGGGKTTLLDVVAGLLSPQQGEVTVDGAALAGAHLDAWRASLAYVGQDGSVFDDSVRGNLLAEGAVADDDAIWSALQLAGLDGRVRAFRGGLDQRIGDRGSHLSGGERQRLAIARALLRRPTLLILDEATSALDPRGEASLLEALRALD
ncbi:MAG TPA: ABC transporter ATP-binding protein, partial [Sphingomicrobium sp.]|nr:ABC transporter ATP-binding protein [Sphingomicrobium sp.]